MSGANVETVRACWGQLVPEWIMVLAEACDRSSQAQIARAIGVSAAVVNQALRNAYTGRLDRLEMRVRGELMRELVECPVLGPVTQRQCLDEQSRPFAATNSLRIQLYRACRVCPHRRSPT